MENGGLRLPTEKELNDYYLYHTMSEGIRGDIDTSFSRFVGDVENMCPEDRFWLKSNMRRSKASSNEFRYYSRAELKMLNLGLFSKDHIVHKADVDIRYVVVPVITDQELLNKLFPSKINLQTVSYGRYPMKILQEYDSEDTEIVNELNKRYKESSLIFTGATFLGYPEFKLGNDTYIRCNNRKFVKDLRSTHRIDRNFNTSKMTFNDYVANTTGFRCWFKVCDVNWTYLEKYNVAICNKSLLRLPFDKSLTQRTNKYEDTSISGYISRALNDELFNQPLNEEVCFSISELVDDKYKLADSDFRYDTSFTVFQKNYDCKGKIFKTYGVTVDASKIGVDLSKAKDNKIHYGEFPQEFFSYKNCFGVPNSVIEKAVPTGKKYHFFKYVDIDNYSIEEVDELMIDNRKFILYPVGEVFEISPVEWEIKDNMLTTTHNIISSIPDGQIRFYFNKYFCKDIMIDKVQEMISDNPGYAFLMNRAGIHTNDIEIDKEGNKLVLKK